MPGKVARSIGQFLFNAAIVSAVLSFSMTALFGVALGLSYQDQGRGGYSLKDMHQVFAWICGIFIVALGILGCGCLIDLTDAVNRKTITSSQIGSYKIEVFITLVVAVVVALSFVGRNEPVQTIWNWLNESIAILLISVCAFPVIGLLLVATNSNKAHAPIDETAGDVEFETRSS